MEEYFYPVIITNLGEYERHLYVPGLDISCTGPTISHAWKEITQAIYDRVEELKATGQGFKPPARLKDTKVPRKKTASCVYINFDKYRATSEAARMLAEGQEHERQMQEGTNND